MSNSNDNMGATGITYNYGDIDGVMVAKIGDVYYNTLQEAINAATDGATVTLLGDTAIKAEDGKPATHAWVQESKNVVIDLNNCTVDGAFFINGTATIKNGTITNNSMVSGIETQGNLTLEDVKITSDRHAVRVSGGTTIINSSEYQTVGISGTKHTINASGNDTVVTIAGGTFIGAGEANRGASGNCVMDQGIKTLDIQGCYGKLGCSDKNGNCDSGIT